MMFSWGITIGATGRRSMSGSSGVICESAVIWLASSSEMSGISIAACESAVIWLASSKAMSCSQVPASGRSGAGI
eukprot:11663548-Heterocapsa_arctica.AAC.1